MNKLTKIGLIGIGTAIAFSTTRKVVAAQNASPKFLLPRNMKISKWFLTFDLPFRLINSESIGYNIPNLGGTLFYIDDKGEKWEFGSYYAENAIEVKALSNDVYITKFSTYLPDVIGAIGAFVSKITKPLKFRATGSFRFGVIPIRYDEPVTITFISTIAKSIQQVFSLFKKK